MHLKAHKYYATSVFISFIILLQLWGPIESNVKELLIIFFAHTLGYSPSQNLVFDNCQTCPVPLKYRWKVVQQHEQITVLIKNQFGGGIILTGGGLSNITVKRKVPCGPPFSFFCLCRVRHQRERIEPQSPVEYCFKKPHPPNSGSCMPINNHICGQSTEVQF